LNGIVDEMTRPQRQTKLPYGLTASDRKAPIIRGLEVIGEERRSFATQEPPSKRSGPLVVSDCYTLPFSTHSIPDDRLPASFTRYAELRFVWGNTGVDGGGELDSGGEDGPVTSTMFESEPVKRTGKSAVVDPHSWLQDDDIED
jgi:hypothetical protein